MNIEYPPTIEHPTPPPKQKTAPTTKTDEQKSYERYQRQRAGELIDPKTVMDYILFFRRHLGIPLTRIRGPLGNLDDPPKDAGKASNAWKSPQHRMAVPKLAPRPGTYIAGVTAEDTGLVILDVDVAADDAPDQEFGPIAAGWLREQLPRTLTVRTCSRRWQFWFRWPPDEPWPSNRRLFEDDRGKVEFKANGYGVLPPGFVGYDFQKYEYFIVNENSGSQEDLPGNYL
jgi:hypothetical protein